MVVVVGLKDTVSRMIANNSELERYTNLMTHLRQLI